jgi:hypothetical protein
VAETLTSVLTQPGELGDFLNLLMDQGSDPDSIVLQVFVPWFTFRAGAWDIAPNFDPRGRMLLLEMNAETEDPMLELPISEDLNPQIDVGGVGAFGLRKVCAGVWALAPSLNLPGLMHAFVVFHGVPDPAPWESRIVLVGA